MGFLLHGMAWPCLVTVLLYSLEPTLAFTGTLSARQWRVRHHSKPPTYESYKIYHEAYRFILFDQLNEQGDIDGKNVNAENLPVIVRGSGDDSVSEEIWENIETGEPPKWLIMKEILGINIFTYILAALIAVFFSLNSILGPGWLGQMIGMEGAGTFTEVSTSLPDTIDLNSPENLL